jgi:cyclic pyranopterin phosphate synthase
MENKSGLTHFNDKGEVHMVDVSDKAVTARKAVAQGRIVMAAETLKMIQQGSHKKGDVLGIARTAGIMAAKKTSELIPLCHPLMLTKVGIDLEVDGSDPAIICTVTAQTTERTGVEMEALTAVQITLLTIYDMCKAVDRGMEMMNIHLVHKSGGKSGDWNW